jgi:MFS family permease
MKVAGGTGFAKLWAAQGISNLGDGVYGTALPLLAATLTRDPLLVSLVSFAEWLPWLLFGLLSGALLDRWDRRRVMWTVDAARFAIVAGLAVAVLPGQAGIALLAVVGFLLGTGQTLVDTGARTTAAMVAVVNLLAAAGGAVMVLFAQEKLGLDAVGFGLLLGGSAVGGVLGSLVAARVVRVVGPARIATWTAINTRTVAEARAAAGLEPGPGPA